jgi:alpha-ketoglutarate-dependent taurine dioxygenase
MEHEDKAALAEVRVGAGASADEVARKVLHCLSTHRLVHVRGLDPDRSDVRRVFDTVLDAVGEAANASEVPDTGEALAARWIDVRFDRALRQQSYRHSDGHQPLHTDAAYDADEGDLVLMYCEVQAHVGGSTTFVDGRDLVDRLEQLAPALYADLRSTPVVFTKNSRRRVRPIVCFDARGPVLTWNYYRVDPEAPSHVKALAEAFHEFLETSVVGSDIERGICLQPGEAAIWHDERMLHGRSAFAADRDGDRLLWKASIRGTAAATLVSA